MDIFSWGNETNIVHYEHEYYVVKNNKIRKIIYPKTGIEKKKKKKKLAYFPFVTSHMVCKCGLKS